MNAKAYGRSMVLFQVTQDVSCLKGNPRQSDGSMKNGYPLIDSPKGFKRARYMIHVYVVCVLEPAAYVYTRLCDRAFKMLCLLMSLTSTMR